MKYSAVLLIATLPLIGTHAYAQDISPGPGTTEVTVIPGGAMFFVNGKTESSFGNYNLGGAFTYNVNRLVGIEGEVGGTLGLTQNLVFGTVTSSQKTPNTLGYTGNVVLSAAAHHGIVPYVTGGMGGLTMFQNNGLAIGSNATFLTANTGLGVKWYANNRVGVRGDYRLTIVRSNDTAPVFFGRETRYGQRLYGGLVLNVTP